MKTQVYHPANDTQGCTRLAKFPVIDDGAAREASQPEAQPVFDRSAGPHLMFASAERQNITLKVRGRAVLLEGGHLVFPIHGSDDVGVGPVIEAADTGCEEGQWQTEVPPETTVSRKWLNDL
jgi:hypothetical protein